MRLLVAALLLLGSAFAQPQPDVVTRGMHGKVHTMHVEAKRGDGMTELQADETFNSDGWLTEEKRYGPNNRLMLYQVLKRNGARVMEQDSTQYFPPEFAGRTVTSFEEHGFPIQQIKYALDGTIRERMQVIYEEAQIRELHYDGNDKLISTRTISTLHDADSHDRHVEQRVNGKREVTTDVHRSGDHVEVKQRQYTHGQLSGQVIRDIQPNATSTAIIHADGSSQAASTRGAEPNEMINPDGSRITSKFNQLGQRIEEDRFDALGKLIDRTTFAYETDDHGNWMRRTAVSSSNPEDATVLIRTFTYY